MSLLQPIEVKYWESEDWPVRDNANSSSHFSASIVSETAQSKFRERRCTSITLKKQSRRVWLSSPKIARQRDCYFLFPWDRISRYLSWVRLHVWALFAAVKKQIVSVPSL